MTIRKTILLRDIVFVGEVSFPDPDKVRVYRDLLGDHAIESGFQEYLETSVGLGASEIKQLCKTLRDLGIIHADGTVGPDFSLREYGKYRLTLLDNRNCANPFGYLPVGLQREKPSSASYSGEPLDKSLLQGITSPRLAPRANFGSFIKSDGPAIVSDRGETEIKVVFDSSKKPAWVLSSGDRIFDFQTTDLPDEDLFFLDDYAPDDDGVKRLMIPFERVKDNPDALGNFICSFTENNRKLDGWGTFSVDYQNVLLMPRQDEARKWYEAVYLDQVREKRSYCSDNELSHLWYSIQNMSPVFSDSRYDRTDFQYDHASTVSHFLPEDEHFWLLQAAEDLNPYSIRAVEDQERGAQETPIAREVVHLRKMADVKLLGDVLDAWPAFRDAREIMIVDRYLNTTWHYRKLRALLQARPVRPERLTVISTASEKITEQRYIDQQTAIIGEWSIDVRTQDKHEIPHDRFWVLDGAFFKLTNSLDFIDLRRDVINIQEDLTIIPLSDADVPREILAAWENAHA